MKEDHILNFIFESTVYHKTLSIDEFIFSGRRVPRVARHVIFWSVLVIGFYIQSLMPVDNAAFAAWMSVCCFFPSCVLSAYMLAYFFLPRFLEPGRYLLLFGGFVALFIVCMILNFYTSILFYELTCNCEVSEMPFYTKAGLGFVNTTHALTIGGLVFGIKIGKDWQQKQKENLVLARQKVANELRFQKSLIHPQFLFRSLSTLQAKILSGAKDSPDVLVKLSDLLSYTLYEGEERQVSLERELAMMQAFVEQERINRGNSFEATIVIEGDPGNKTISPLLLLSLMQGCLEDTAKEEPVQYIIRIAIESETSSLRLLLTRNMSNTENQDQAWMKIVNTVRDRMAVFPHRSFRLQPDYRTCSLSLEIFLGQDCDEFERTGFEIVNARRL